MGFDISKFKVPVDNGKWAETDLISSLKVATTLFNGKRKSIVEMLLNPPKTPLHEIFEAGVEYSIDEVNENGVHMKLHTNLDKVDSALDFINEGKHPLIKKANFVRRVISPFTDTIELWMTRINGDEIIIRYVDGKVYRSIAETETITRERPI